MTLTAIFINPSATIGTTPLGYNIGSGRTEALT